MIFQKHSLPVKEFIKNPDNYFFTSPKKMEVLEQDDICHCEK